MLTRDQLDDELRMHRAFLRALVKWIDEEDFMPPSVRDVSEAIEDFLRIEK